jgi:F-type H+-transporting ATPase subunit b
VALSMLVVIALLIWKRVPRLIGRALDTKIEGIRSQLDEATRLRAEAEGLKAEYTAKAAAAAQEAEAMLAGARAEADGIVAKAQADASALIERRGRMAEEKIAAAERAAVAEVRTRAATAATAAAASLIAQRYDALADRALVSRTINELGSARLS